MITLNGYKMSLFVDLRQIKSSVTNLSDMVDKISSTMKQSPLENNMNKDDSALYRSSIYKPTTLGFGVRFSSQEDVYDNISSSRLRSHMSLPNLRKKDEYEKPSMLRRGSTPKIVEIDDEKSNDSRRPTIQLSTENLSEWILASINKRPHFDGSGETHPMDFIETVKYYISELNMAEEKQLTFILSCLDGVPHMWARCFKNEFINLDDFYNAFEQEFWGSDQQKSVLYDLKLGKYNEEHSRMSMSEYFLHKVTNYRHLNPPPSDLEIVYSLAAHFPTAVELELRLTPKPTLRDAYRILRRREGEPAGYLPNYLYEMCEEFHRGQQPSSARRHEKLQNTTDTERKHEK